MWRWLVSELGYQSMYRVASCRVVSCRVDGSGGREERR